MKADQFAASRHVYNTDGQTYNMGVNQKELKELENRCIQEEAPWCTARCPIHVDVRGFLRKAASGLWNESVQVLAVTMPFPGVVGRICTHPCEAFCKRSEAGEAIAIGAVERAAVEYGTVTKRRIPLPRKDMRVAIAGGGLDGLTVAWDLAHKGYEVSVFVVEGCPGSGFGEYVAARVPRDVIEKELAILEGLHVEIHHGPEGDDSEWISRLMQGYDAVYVGLESESRSRLETLGLDPLTLAAPGTGLFVSPGQAGSGFSPVEAVAGGRKAATSIDRFIQRVSLTAGREKESPYETRLFTSLQGVLPLARVNPEDPGHGYSEDEAKREADRCLHCECLECVKVCLYLERFKGYPKQYVRQISNNETIVMGNHGQINRLINSCSLCGLCAEVCPTGLSVAEICMEGRRGLVRRGKMPPSVHEFALEDMRSANSAKSTLAAHEPGRETSAFAFFPGCQLGASSPDHVVRGYGWLREHLEGGVGLIIRCCGAPAEWAGREDLLRKSLDAFARDWEALGRPVVIAACPACYRILKTWCGEVEATTLWHMMGNHKWEKKWAGKTFAVHDSCTARYEPGMRDAVRRIVTGLGSLIEELPLTGEKTECCGFGGLMSTANPTLARDVAQRRISLRQVDYVTYCVMCRNSLRSSGGKATHLLDLLFGPSAGEAATLIDRRDRRYGLKQRLATGLWGGKERVMEEHEKIVLRIDTEVRDVMEERRILTEDVQKAVGFAATRFYDRAKGRWLVAYRPDNVTYWVEYGEEGDGYRIFNAYCHRMEVVERTG